MSRILIIGGGASGMMAGIAASSCGHEVHIFEKNEKLGKKLFITGKGRCNLTNDCSPDCFFDSVIQNPKFLYSAYHGFDCSMTKAFFQDAGVPLKTERGCRVFPCSDHSSDIIRALSRSLEKAGVRIHLNEEIAGIRLQDGAFSSLRLRSGHDVCGDSCILAAGGASYPSTGSDGTGYRLAERLGHTIVKIRPSLVPLEVRETCVRSLQGLSLKNVGVTVSDGTRVLYRDFGEMLFTHYGVSGPLILSMSSIAGQTLQDHPLALSIDLKPALDYEKLDARILREFDANENKNFQNAVAPLFPASLLPVIVEMSEIPADKKVYSVTRQERKYFEELIKNFPLTLTKLRGFDEAVVTSGGVCTSEVNPSTMESRLVPGLYFTGEMLDVDALTGGFNLQIAWSTGYAAGIHQR